MKYSKAQITDFAVLILRWYLAYYMVDFGWGKMTGNQFSVYDPKILEQPLKDVDKFYIAWYLFGKSPVFDIVVGIFQIIGAVLIVINRTTLIGALMLLPILGQIFLVDVAFTMNVHASMLPVRLLCMILSDVLILWYYKDKMIAAWHLLTDGITTHYKYKWWLYLLLPIIGLLMDFVWGIISWPISHSINWLMSH